jgi:UDP-N-acetylmuramate dehydrogenase
MRPIQYNIPLAPLSTFNIGGNASEFVEVKTPDELISIVSWTKEKRKSYKLFAGGSNVVFPDQGIDELVIRVIGGKLGRTDTFVVSDTGVLLADLVDFANNQGLGGTEKLVGIPGTVGGAVVGNAGAYGITISDCLVWVEVWDGKKRKKISWEDYSLLFQHRRGSS